MSKSSTKMNAAKTGGVLVAACVACCAPLIAPPVIALFAAGGVTLSLLGQFGLAALFLAGGGAYIWYRHKRRKAQLRTKSCSCGPNAGCNAGESCELPIDKPESFMDRLKSIC